ncbi:cytochrome c [Longimicrobium sp.]|uniref:c-type cytochrome n=1 Tax=Longimicrobium sp. TaxID=2029185 RepID=UPI002E37A070|nr:cytochrome c [Longimicrobium sp.]HEX6039987.1 cytochrome c [Longimicrobium sp.]
MKADVFRRRRSARAAWLALPAVAALLAGCEPGAVGGYPKLVYRDDPQVPRAAYPDPPAVTPGSAVSGSAARIVATNLPGGVTQAMVDQGQDLYGTVCAACHGQGGAGSAAAPKLADNQWLNISGQYPEIVTLINNGVPAPKQYPGMMPPKGGGSFDDAQVRAIAAYVFALSHQGGA